MFSGRDKIVKKITSSLVRLQQELAPITSYDTAGTFLLLGSSNGSIHYIDMQKFPLRMKDNDLLVRIAIKFQLM